MSDSLENIREFIDQYSDEELRKAINEIPLEDLIENWHGLDQEEELRFFSLLNLQRKVDLINSIPASSQEMLITDLSGEHKRILLEEMEPDDLTDFVQSISSEVRNAVWRSLSDDAKQETLFLLKFDEDDAAGLMTPRYLALSSSLNVSQALSWVRKNAADVETVYYIYVIDQLKRLRGIVSLRQMLTARDEDLIENIMVKKVISVREDTDQEEAAHILETHDFVALPVVDDYNRLLGIITFDDVIDVIREEQTEDIYKMGAMGGGTERYLESSLWNLIGKRIPWLGILLIAATLTTNVLSYFESLFVAATVLTLFIPTIIGTGGNSGTQSATLIIRGLAMGELHFQDFGRVLIKEIAVAAVIGISMGALIVVRSVFLPPFIGWHEAVTVGIALSFVIVVATLVGASAPLIINRLGMDPTVMAAPLMATLIDIAGLTVYFLTARILLGLH
jgi:magnesium transporter